jgi:hypothetical protein
MTHQNWWIAAAVATVAAVGVAAFFGRRKWMGRSADHVRRVA